MVNGTKNPKVSIIILSYNNSEFIDEAIKSCLNQEYKNKEIILIDDCSTDSSLKKIESFQHHIKIIKNQKNHGPLFNRILGSKISNGDLLFFLDGDDYIHNNNSIENLIDIWKKFNEPDILGFNFFYLNNSTKKESSAPEVNLIKNNLISTKTIDYFIWNSNYGLSSCSKKLYSSSFFKENIKELKNIENRYFLEDWVMNIFLFLRAKKVAITKYTPYVYRVGIEQATNFSKSLEKAIFNLNELKNAIGDAKNFIINSPKYNKDKDYFDFYIESKIFDFYFWIKTECLQYFSDDRFFGSFCEVFPKQSKIDLLKIKLANKNIKHYKYDISIIIPIYNTEQYLERCINSIVKNITCDKKIQIILINDCSEGNIKKLYENKFKKHNFISLHNNEYNMGSLYSRIKGLFYVESPWIHFVDADDLVNENAYLCLAKVGKKIDCIYTNFHFLRDETFEKHNHNFNKKIIKKPFQFYLQNIDLRRSLWNKLFRTEICLKSVNDVQVVNTSVSDDHFLNLLFFNKCRNMKIINDSIYSYYISNGESISSNVELKYKATFDIHEYIPLRSSVNLKLLKYIKQRELSFFNINYFIDKRIKKNNKLKFFWDVNKYADSVYCFISLVQKQFDLFMECSTKTSLIFEPLKIQKIITDGLWGNESLDFFKKCLWRKSPSKKFGVSRYFRFVFTNNPIKTIKLVLKKLKFI